MKKAITKYYQIKSDKIAPSEFPTRIAFISDLHNVEIGERNRILFKKLESLSPDLVLLGGDIIIGRTKKPMDAGLDFIKNLGAKFKVYAVNGNHEYRLKIYPETYGDMYERYERAMKEANVTVLNNEQAQVMVNGTNLVIHGLEIDREYYGRLKKKELSVADIDDYLGQIEDDKYHILLAHNPRFGQGYMEWGADLTLSGHYHGGVIKLPHDKPLLGNDFQIFPAFAYGHYEEKGHHLITSAGLGEHTIPLRINNPREIVVVDIVSNQK